MKYATPIALLAALAGVPALAQEVTASSTTFLQDYKRDATGLTQGSFTPATEFLGIDVTKLDPKEALSLHLYGWGTADLGDQSSSYGRSSGDLTYGYLQYRFDRANAQVKAGRITVNQGLGPVQLDGAEARTDLLGGLTISAFGGKPVVYKNLSNFPQSEISFQQDVMFGGRLGWRFGKAGEIGVSYLQQGSHSASQIPNPVDYTRRMAGADISLRPCSFLDLAGRTVWDVANNQENLPNTRPSRTAEHDYKATAKLAETVSLTGTFAERNYYAYYAGTTLPSLFNQDEQGQFKATGASLTWAPATALQIAGDVRRTDRTAFGTSTRAGADVRCHVDDDHVQFGAGYHRVNAFSLVAGITGTPSYSLSHDETRAWVMAEHGALSASLDAILLNYRDAAVNPNLYGHSSESAVTGSVGYQVKGDLKVSGDLTVEDTPRYRQTSGLVRVQYRLSSAGKGGN